MNKQTKFVEDEGIQVCNSLTLDEANALAFKVISLVDTHLQPIEIVGSARRCKPIVKDIDFVGVGSLKGWNLAKKSLIGMLDAKVKMEGPKILRMLMPSVRGHVQIDLYRATEETYGVLKLIRTGSAEHNVWLAGLAIKKGMRLLYSQGLVDRFGKVVAGREEKEVFEALGLEYVIPSEREIVRGKPVWLNDL